MPHGGDDWHNVIVGPIQRLASGWHNPDEGPRFHRPWAPPAARGPGPAGRDDRGA
jgi:hypothetical protein